MAICLLASLLLNQANPKTIVEQPEVGSGE